MKNFNAKNFVLQMLISGAIVFAFLFFKGNGFLYEYIPPDPIIWNYKWYVLLIGVILMWGLFLWLTMIVWNLIKK